MSWEEDDRIRRVKIVPDWIEFELAVLTNPGQRVTMLVNLSQVSSVEDANEIIEDAPSGLTISFGGRTWWVIRWRTLGIDRDWEDAKPGALTRFLYKISR